MLVSRKPPFCFFISIKFFEVKVQRDSHSASFFVVARLWDPRTLGLIHGVELPKRRSDWTRSRCPYSGEDSFEPDVRGLGCGGRVTIVSWFSSSLVSGSLSF